MNESKLNVFNMTPIDVAEVIGNAITSNTSEYSSKLMTNYVMSRLQQCRYRDIMSIICNEETEQTWPFILFGALVTPSGHESYSLYDTLRGVGIEQSDLMVLWQTLVRGGMIIRDEYFSVDDDGTTNAWSFLIRLRSGDQYSFTISTTEDGQVDYQSQDENTSHSELMITALVETGAFGRLLDAVQAMMIRNTFQDYPLPMEEGTTMHISKSGSLHKLVNAMVKIKHKVKTKETA
jgi:hypothetical protein